MATGIVKFFNATKGFGFIVPEDGGQDVFIHKTAVEIAGLSVLKKGEALSFQLIKDKKGQVHASELQVLGSSHALQSPDESKTHDIKNAARARKYNTSRYNNSTGAHQADTSGQSIAYTKFAKALKSNERQLWQHNYDKYTEFARHEEDLVTREGHWQHAEHYLRLLNGSVTV
jgi:CspA family cold shock protein